MMPTEWVRLWILWAGVAAMLLAPIGAAAPAAETPPPLPPVGPLPEWTDSMFGQPYIDLDGYIYGGSGGSLKTVCAFENSFGVWDGAVPYVYGTPMSMPNVFSVAAHAKRLVKDKFPSIIDALDPGGSGDPYAGLNEEERGALHEVTRMGMPPRAWYAYQRLGYGPMAGLINNIRKWYPQYFEDFLKVPGYLGAAPPASLKVARVQQSATIARVIMSGTSSVGPTASRSIPSGPAFSVPTSTAATAAARIMADGSASLARSSWSRP